MNKLPRYLVVGSGNMARRHITNLKILFPSSCIGCISSSGKPLRPSDMGADIIYSSLAEALEKPLQFAIVATPAPFHLEQAAALLKKGVAVLIEKPLTDSWDSFKKVADILYEHQHKIEVAYNLRYLPTAIHIKKLLEQGLLGNVKTVMVDVGQYLPQWRPHVDYRSHVSAKKSLGGGVLLELSHELDYLTWLFGKFDNVYCITSTSGMLEGIDVEDMGDAIFTQHNGIRVNLHMDFLQHKSCRTCKIVGEKGTLKWDLLRSSISFHDKDGVDTILYENPQDDRGASYIEELRRFSKVAAGELAPAVNLQQGLTVLTLIEAMRRSSASQRIVAIEEVY